MWSVRRSGCLGWTGVGHRPAGSARDGDVFPAASGYSALTRCPLGVRCSARRASASDAASHREVTMWKGAKRLVWLVAAVVVIRAAARPGRPLNRAVVSVGDRLAPRSPCMRGPWQGVRYRLRGEHPDAEVSDLVLADRVRSSLGPLEKQLDMPRVHVMVDDHVVLLHGDAPGEAEARAIEKACIEISGVAGVESYLHVGLLPSDSRPSEGRAHPAPSTARKRLVAAAVAGGVDPGAAGLAVRAVLATFAARLPDGERQHLLAHLPDDVRGLADPPRRHGDRPSRVRTTPELVHEVLRADGGMATQRGRGGHGRGSRRAARARARGGWRHRRRATGGPATTLDDGGSSGAQLKRTATLRTDHSRSSHLARNVLVRYRRGSPPE